MRNRRMIWKFAAFVCTLALAAFMASTSGLAQQEKQGPSDAEKAAAKAAWPKDVNRDSGYRLPYPKRDDMDEAGKKVYDQLIVGNNVGMVGPFGVQMYSPQYQAIVRQLNQFLRSDAAGLPPHVQEVSILLACRESNADFEWTAHEELAQKAGVDQKVIDAIKFRKGTEGLPEADAALIQLGREIYEHKKVSSETFAHVNKLYGPGKLVNIVGLMGFYSTAAAELETFGFEMPAGQKSLLPASGR
jgi:4-carboxymuconolactone decarboxylase